MDGAEEGAMVEGKADGLRVGITEGKQEGSLVGAIEGDAVVGAEV